MRAAPIAAPLSVSTRSPRHPAVSRVVTCAATPTVSDTKAAFLAKYSKPVNPIFSTVINELLVTQHLWRYQKKYAYDPVFAVGVVSVMDQVVEDLIPEEREALFNSYISALQEDPAAYKSDAAAFEAWAKEVGAANVKPNAEGDKQQKAMAAIAERIASGNFYYSRFFAIGLFRLLEVGGASTPEALKTAVEALGVDMTVVSRDLNAYKGMLSKMSGAKELMKEFLERERRKQAERDAAKASKASTEESAPTAEATASA